MASIAIVKSVTIASGASVSGSTFAEGNELVAIHMPSAWTTANLSFRGSVDNVTFGDMYNAAGAEVVVNADASRFILIPSIDMAGLYYIQVRSGTALAPVTQTAQRIINLIFREG